MGWILVVLGVFVLAGSFIEPRSFWRATAAWKYRYPDANEPSDTAYQLRRFGFVVVGVVLATAGLALNQARYDSPWGVHQSLSSVDDSVELR